ncbi:delta-aminolevulinic acid dehydratase [Thermoplasma volcanium GSS1]|uniref:Delta-aminolevulinic acid dehydratase n=1 Tax=Thermoplasma volcanium (strain ATCC 51530 / DSM 4299 / JCM 9571 / NBRC 15438 / GSS1) TaxID=273116 RepID=Q979N6_THEVO|nr:porphobilinogen synthase [Thermoplasma volcanium]BAB60266.1 delta-aminolevulinic acid dehydratase [Thermoplasma volcanium GSS1]
MYPIVRMRRYRKDQNLRDFISEIRVSIDKLIMPIFIDENIKEKTQISSMPGIFRYPISQLEDYVKHLEDIGIKSVLLFGIPKYKDSFGSSAYDKNSIIQRSISLIKETTDIVTIADLCLCEYTDTGQCGLISNDYVDNDKTLEVYRKIAVSYAEAGVDIVAPSGMMDGQVKAIREALDSSGYVNTMIMAYSSKFSSNLYGPFREAAESAPKVGDRKSYQLDYRNGKEAIREIELDIDEGADIVMVKPAIFYLDIIRSARDRFNLPLAAYSVSGEYSMIVNAVNQGLIGEDSVNEALTAVFRAGADIVITYFAERLAESRKA